MIKDYYIYDGTTLLGLLYIPVGVSSDKIIPSFITTLGKGCFKNQNFSTIIIPPSIKIIEDNVFENCKFLTSLEIPSTVETVGNNICCNCNKLQTFKYSSTTQMGKFILQNCYMLKELIINDENFRVWYHNSEKVFGIGVLDYVTDNGYKIYKGHWSIEELLGWGLPVGKENLIYFVEYNNKVWYDPSLEQAYKGCQYLNSNMSICDFFHKKFLPMDTITWSEFSIILGICSQGKPFWDLMCHKDLNTNNDNISVNDLIKVLQKHQFLSPILLRWVEVLQHKNECFTKFTDISYENINLSQYFQL